MPPAPSFDGRVYQTNLMLEKDWQNRLNASLIAYCGPASRLTIFLEIERDPSRSGTAAAQFSGLREMLL
jgi:hypothetical protein